MNHAATSAKKPVLQNIPVGTEFVKRSGVSLFVPVTTVHLLRPRKNSARAELVCVVLCVGMIVAVETVLPSM